MGIKELNFEVVSTEEDRQKLMDLIIECADSMVRANAEKDLQKERIKIVGKELSVSKAIIKKMITTYYKQNFDDLVATQEEFEKLYTKVVKQEDDE